MAKQPMQKLITAFKEAQDMHPFLILEVGYSRIMDWTVIIWNSQSVGMGMAHEIISIQDYRSDKAAKHATKALRKWLRIKNSHHKSEPTTPSRPPGHNPVG